MSTCSSIRDLLVLDAEHTLSDDQARRLAEHLAGCPGCRKERGEIGRVVEWLRDPELFRPAADLDWNLLPDRLAVRAAELPISRRWTPLHSRPPAWALTLAATFLLGCAAIWMLQNRFFAPLAPLSAGAAPGNEAFLARMHAAYAREATADYLGDCRDLLVNLLGANGTCEGDRYDVALEVSQAQLLLQRKRLLEAELTSPDVLRAKALCDEIENFLVNLSTSQTCARPEEIRRMERFIEREQLLLRINLLQSELSGE